MENMASDAPNGARRIFPTDPDLDVILGRTDFDFEFFLLICWTPNFWISMSPDLQNLARARLGLGQAKLEPSGPENVDFLL